MMLNKFNKLVNLILQQHDFTLNQSEIQFQNQSIAIVPGSFKPPHKGHWEMVMHYVPLVDKVIVLISNISSEANAQRILSLSNLKKFGKIEKFIKQNNLHDCDQIINDINSNINSISFSTLTKCFDELIKICQENISQNKLYIQLKGMILTYQKQLKQNVFKSIRKAGDKQITPQMSKQIFQIFAKAYGVDDKVIIQISKSASPITDTLQFVNYKCKDCKILLGVSKKGGDQARWNGIQKSIKNETVQVIPDPVQVKTMLSATELRNNILNLKKQYFPEKISDSDFEKIKDILES